MITKKQWNEYIDYIAVSLDKLKPFQHITVKGQRVNYIRNDEIHCSPDMSKGTKMVFKHPESFMNYNKCRDMYEGTLIHTDDQLLNDYMKAQDATVLTIPESRKVSSFREWTLKAGDLRSV